MVAAGCTSEALEYGDARTVNEDGEVSPLLPDDRDVATMAVTALADDLGIPNTDITVDTVRPVDWPNSAIGCPQPGEAYLDVITPGHKVTLRVGGDLHVVHEARGRAFVCRQRKLAQAPGAELDVPWLEMSVAARSDLASKLGAREEEIIIGGANRTTFTDSSLGCPSGEGAYEQGNIPGYVLSLRYGSRNFSYHTDLDRVIACPPITED